MATFSFPAHPLLGLAHVRSHSTLSLPPYLPLHSLHPPTRFRLQSELIFADEPITLHTKAMSIAGTLRGGSATCRLRSPVTITLHGTRAEQKVLPASPEVKGIYVTGTADVHGAL